jgi:N-acyl-D-aspartate/D-glutamate deacylase
MEGVEDIPGTALAEGIDWSWESFPEYLDALDRMPRAIGRRDAGSARRRARLRDGRPRRENQPPTADDIAHGRDRARRPRGRRARLLDVAHLAAPRARTASRCPAPSPARRS